MASLARISKDNKKDEREDMGQINNERERQSKNKGNTKKRTYELKEPVNRTKKKKARKGKGTKEKKRTVKCSLYSVK